MFSRTTSTPKYRAKNLAPAAGSYGSESPRVGTVADRIKQFNNRATEAQVEAAQVLLLQSHPTTPGEERLPPILQSNLVINTPSVPLKQAARDQTTSAADAPARVNIPGDWPMEDKLLQPDAYVVPLLKHVQPPSRIGSRSAPGVVSHSTVSAPVSPKIRAAPGPTSGAPIEFKHRETLSFEAPAGPRTDYAYERHHHKRDEQERGWRAYNPQLPEEIVDKPMPMWWQSRPIRDARRKAPSESSRPSSVHNVHELNDANVSAAWATLHNISNEENAAEHKIPPSLVHPVTDPPTIIPSPAFISSRRYNITDQHRDGQGLDEGAGNPLLTISAKGIAPDTDQVTEVISKVPLSRFSEPQAILTLAVSNMPQAFVQIQSARTDSPVQTVLVPGKTVPMKTAPFGQHTSTTRLGSAAVNVEDEAHWRGSSGISTPTGKDVPSMFQRAHSGTIKTPSPNPHILQSTTQLQHSQPVSQSISPTRDVLDAIIIEHSAALKAITRKLGTELARLEVDYDAVLLATPPHSPNPDAIVATVPTSASWPEPHRTIASDVMADLGRLSRYMEKLVDEVVRTAREVWCVNLLSHEVSLLRYCFEGWDAKILQIETEQLGRARYVRMWAGAVDVEPAPLRWRRRGGNVAADVDFTHQKATRLEKCHEEKDQTCVLPISVLSNMGIDFLRETVWGMDLVELRTRNPRCFVFPPPSSYASTVPLQTPPSPSIIPFPRLDSPSPSVPPSGSSSTKVGTRRREESRSGCWNDTGLLDEYCLSFDRAGSQGFMIGRAAAAAAVVACSA